MFEGKVVFYRIGKEGRIILTEYCPVDVEVTYCLTDYGVASARLQEYDEEFYMAY